MAHALADGGELQSDSGCRSSSSVAAAQARMAELADALDSGSSGRKVVEVRALFRALSRENPRAKIAAHHKPRNGRHGLPVLRRLGAAFPGIGRRYGT